MSAVMASAPFTRPVCGAALQSSRLGAGGVEWSPAACFKHEAHLPQIFTAVAWDSLEQSPCTALLSDATNQLVLCVSLPPPSEHASHQRQLGYFSARGLIRVGQAQMFRDCFLSWAEVLLLERFSDLNLWLVLVPGPLDWHFRDVHSSCSIKGIVPGSIIKGLPVGPVLHA